MQDIYTKVAIKAAKSAKRHADGAEKALAKYDRTEKDEHMDALDDHLAWAGEHHGNAFANAHAAHALANGKDPHKAMAKASKMLESAYQRHMGDIEDGLEATKKVHKMVEKRAVQMGYTPAAQAMEEASSHHLRATEARYRDV